MNKKIRQELIIWVQYFLIAFIATSIAYSKFESTLALSDTEGLNTPNYDVSINIKEMIYSMWYSYYRWWLVAFIVLSLFRFFTTYIINRFRSAPKLK
jgi:hypothetical protein